MTKKTAESELSQLKTALIYLGNHWETVGSQVLYYAMMSATPDELPRAIGEVSAFWQASLALNLLINKIKALPDNADDAAIRQAAFDASFEAIDARKWRKKIRPKSGNTCARLSGVRPQETWPIVTYRREANLSEADLSLANLDGTTGLTDKQLSKVKSLKGATMPDGTTHE
jgi:hypothetical protein